MLIEFGAVAILLGLLTLGFFWQILLTPSTWMPAGGGDLAPFLYPNYLFATQNLRQGVIPLWNPHLYGGAPFAADIQSGLFYPVNLLVFVLVPRLTYEWLEYLAIFHFWLAGMTMYACLRLLRPPTADGRRQTVDRRPETGDQQPLIADHQPETADRRSPIYRRHAGPNLQSPITNLHPLAALAGAIAFEFSDLFIVHFGNLNMIAVAAWLPLVFLLFHKSLQRQSLGLAAAAGVVLAVATLAGHIQITLFILLTLGLYSLWHIGFTISLCAPSADLRFTIFQSPISTQSVQSLLALLTTLLVTIGLSALLLFPAYELSRYTPRAELPYGEAAAYSLHPVQLVGLLIPNYFGRDPALHWGPWERVETGYIGLMPLLLALIGIRLYRSRLKYFFLGLGLIALALALGDFTPVHGWLYALAPGFDQLRAPARFILLLDFSLAVLAAFGLNTLLQGLDAAAQAAARKILKGLTWILGGLIVVAAPLSYFALLVTQDRNPAIFTRAAAAAAGVATFAIFAVAALIILYLITNYQPIGGLRLLPNWPATPEPGVGTRPAGLITTYHLPPRLAGLAAILVITLDLFTLGYNVDTGHANPAAGFDHPAALAFLQADPNPYRIEVTTDVWHAWQPNTALLHGLYDVWGLYNPLTLADTTLYWSGAPPRNSGRYNFLGVKYIIASKAGAPADGDIVPVFEGDPEINIYLNQSALPRALFVTHATITPNHDAAWQALRADDFDPSTTVILEADQHPSAPPSLQPSSPPISQSAEGTHSAIANLSFLHYSLHTVTLAVDADQPGYLVLPDAYYPGWQASVDGRPQPLWRANYAFRAVYVPAGAHTVQFVFDPLIWKLGLAVSGLTVLGLFGWAGWRWRRPGR